MASDLDLDLPHVSFRVNPEVAELPRIASLAAVKADAKTIAQYIKRVRVSRGFEGQTDPPPGTENITWAFAEDEDVPAARVGMPEAGAPEREFWTLWETGHHNLFKSGGERPGKWVREPWLSDSMRNTRAEAARKAARAAENVQIRVPGIRSAPKAATGLALFSVVSLFT